VSPLPVHARVLWLAAGGTWAARSLMVFAHPAYTAPVTTLDWLAVWSFSLAFVFTALAVVTSPTLTPTSGSRLAALIIAAASLVAGIANALEDGFGVSAMFTVFAVSALIALYGPFVVAAIVARAARGRLAAWWAAIGLGFLTFPAGGSVIVFAASLVLVLRPSALGPSPTATATA